MRKIESIDELRAGMELVYNGRNTLMGFTQGGKYSIVGFYNGKEGIVIPDNTGYKETLTFNQVSCYFMIPDSEIMPMEEKVSHPPHYTWLKERCGIEVIDITRNLDFDTGNAVKYLLRAGHKNEKGYTGLEKEIEDLRKAAWYINDRILTLQRRLKDGQTVGN